MIEVNNIEVFNLKNAIRGMRNPLESWDKSDSFIWKNTNEYIIGENDRNLALNLIRAGSDHRKFMRQIFISMDITAPMTWWWDMDTYKVSTTANSTSRMHKLGTRLLTANDFSWDNEKGIIEITPFRECVLNDLNERITKFQELKNIDSDEAKKLWRTIVFDLPDSYNFLKTWTGTYEVLRNIYFARRNHKQKEFRDFCNVLETLPYSEFITMEDK